ncbi:LOW QUALITY PROTEIN: DNA-directed RNA polymerase III subunit RPC7 [Sylvia borin]
MARRRCGPAKPRRPGPGGAGAGPAHCGSGGRSVASTDNKPVPLKTRDEDYMLALKQDVRATTKKWFIQEILEQEKKDEGKSKNEKDKRKDGEDDEEAEEPGELENDYISSCFEDGDAFDAFSDDNMIEAT